MTDIWYIFFSLEKLQTIRNEFRLFFRIFLFSFFLLFHIKILKFSFLLLLPLMIYAMQVMCWAFFFFFWKKEGKNVIKWNWSVVVVQCNWSSFFFISIFIDAKTNLVISILFFFFFFFILFIFIFGDFQLFKSYLFPFYLNHFFFWRIF